MTAGASRFDVRLVPPVGWGSAGTRDAARRVETLDGLIIGLLSNGKPNGMELLDAVVEQLGGSYRIAEVIRHTKPHPSLPMSDEVMTLFAEHAHAVLSAIGD